MIATLAFLSILGQKAEAPFAILGDDLPAGAFVIDKVSWNGKWILGHTGHLQNGPFWLLGTDSLTELRCLEMSNVRLTGVRDDGTVVVGVVDKSTQGPGRNRIAVVNNAKLSLLGRGPVGTPGNDVTPTGLSHDGDILGYEIEPHDTYSRVIYYEINGQRAKALTVFYTFGHYSGLVLDRTENGYLVTLPHRKTIDGQSRREEVGYLRGDIFTPLQSVAGYPTSWSRDGAYLVINRGERSELWVHGENQGEILGKQLKHRFKIEAISDDGTVAVGKAAPGKNEYAVIWTPSDGARPLARYISDHHIPISGGWVLTDACYISGDGSFIVGVARRANGEEKPYRLKISGA